MCKSNVLPKCRYAKVTIIFAMSFCEYEVNYLLTCLVQTTKYDSSNAILFATDHDLVLNKFTMV